MRTFVAFCRVARSRVGRNSFKCMRKHLVRLYLKDYINEMHQSSVHS